ncbi:MAG: site-specific DNA-methyltransferase [Synergistaceae bacterium]|nr:site-specific DNA-methyltransferase [Synergistaceae bacterium]
MREGKVSLNLQRRIHTTQKPVELHMEILQDFSKENDVILDCFGGSGTTLIACEMTGRTCLMMEISPRYCDIICERYNKLTGIGQLKLF